MIAANELRYGVNVIGKGLNEGRVLTFNSLHRTDNTIAFFQNSELGEHLKDLDAIPLTEEWLLKFGFYKPFLRFTKVNGGWDYLDQNSLRINEYPIKYVHQLQNLYFALTGKELELKKETV